MKAKHRVRFVTACYRAELGNLLLVGAANRTEKLTGLFCKFGVDHCADIMPIGPLYRSEVLKLAAHLGVPRRVLEKPPDPGLAPGLEDKYRFFIGLPSEDVDRILDGLVRDARPAELAQQLELPLERIEDLRELMSASAHKRNPSQEPRLSQPEAGGHPD